MAHLVNKPADTQTIAQGPADIRAEIAKVANDQVTDAGTLKGLTPGNAAGQIPVSNGIINAGLNAEKLGGNLPSAFAPVSHEHNVATGFSHGFIDNADWNKLQGIAAGAEVNQNAFSSVLVNGTTIQADSKTDTLELAAGANIALIPDATNDRVTISVSGKVANAAVADTAVACSGNAATATTLVTARTIALSGKVTGTATSFNGGANISIPVTAVTADSCTGNAATATNATNHIAAVSGAHAAAAISCAATGDVLATTVQAAISELASEKAPKTSPAFTGTPTAPTAASATNSTQIATTAFVKAAITAGGGGIIAASLAANGYVKFANGLIIQWGIGNTHSNIYFPIAFPNICCSFNAMFTQWVGGNDTNLAASKNTAYAYIDSEGSSSPQVQYIAIGY
jgi:hypothetical protein